MRLAGQMRLTTFLSIAGTGLLVASLGGFAGLAWWWSNHKADPPTPATVSAPVPETPAPTPAPILPAPPPAPAPTAADPRGAREVDAVVLSYRGKALGSDKLKDVTQGKPWKVNVYQDAGNPTANRAKIDLDRDDRWDEKITFEESKVTRQVATADDEWYDQTYHWDGSAWVPE